MIDRTVRRLGAELLDCDGIDLVMKMTLVYLLAMNSGPWYARIPELILCALGLVTSLGRSPGLWLAMAAALGGRVLSAWYQVDNHDYLAFYWALAIALAVATRQPRAIAVNGRLLIGLCFLFATLWKGFLSDSYVDGGFFHHTFLRDVRFARMGALSGGMDESLFEENAEVMDNQLRSPERPETLALHTTAQLGHLARLATWYTLIIEGAIAVMFLWPGGLFHRARDAVLLVFTWSTYAVAPVPGFGGVLMLMGMAQSEFRLVRGLYLGSFFLVYIYRYVPWQTWMSQIFLG